MIKYVEEKVNMLICCGISISVLSRVNILISLKISIGGNRNNYIHKKYKILGYTYVYAFIKHNKFAVTQTDTHHT